MSVLMVVTIQIKNSEKLKTYMSIVQKIAANYGAEIMAKGKHARSLTEQNNVAHHMVAIIKFPTIEKLEDWVKGEPYQSIIPLRQEAAEMSMNVYKAL